MFWPLSCYLIQKGEFIFRLKAQALYDSPATNWFVKAPERELTKNSITSTFFSDLISWKLIASTDKPFWCVCVFLFSLHVTSV